MGHPGGTPQLGKETPVGLGRCRTESCVSKEEEPGPACLQELG